MKFQLRGYQAAAVDYAIEWLSAAKAGEKLLIASPTGTGKSVVELAIQEQASKWLDTWIVTPRVEIIAGLLDKLEWHQVDTLTEEGLLRAALAAKITTPLRLRNAMLEGRGPNIGCLVIDEAHHDTATTYEQLHLLTGRCPAIGLTATPFRGTPKGTAAFRESWGEPVWAITMGEAVAEGYLAFPSVSVLPLVDDETLTIANGEFSVASVNAVSVPRLAEAATWIKQHWTGADGMLQRPTMASLPSRGLAWAFASELHYHGVRNVVVTGETSAVARQAAFDACIHHGCLLVQINVVSEGVDLPIRRLFDMSPTMSPVRWLQQLGRITRPVTKGEAPPDYVCTNRNLLRHAYLLEGCLPPQAVIDAQKAFGTPGARATNVRSIGLEAIGKLRAVELPLTSGLTGFMYAVSSVEGASVRQYVALIHPLRGEPVWASRTNARGADGMTAAYGRWERCDAPTDLTGFASLPGSPVSEKQLAWWKRSAASRGLDATIEPTRKQFAALPVLSDLRVRLQ